MLEQIRQIPAETLSFDEYLADFERNQSLLTHDHCYKLERSQTFEEPYDPGWRAFMRGDWDEALKIEDDNYRPQAAEEISQLTQQGVEWRRLRVVELPPTPYLQWECHSLKIQAEEGKQIRVTPTETLAGYEKTGTLPEIVILGSQVLYEVLYRKNNQGEPYAARKITDPHIIAECRTEIHDIYQTGEDFMSFYQREIAHLPAPQIAVFD